MAFLCDFCGGQLEMISADEAVCEKCGMHYQKGRLLEMIREEQARHMDGTDASVPVTSNEEISDEVIQIEKGSPQQEQSKTGEQSGQDPAPQENFSTQSGQETNISDPPVKRRGKYNKILWIAGIIVVALAFLIQNGDSGLPKGYYFIISGDTSMSAFVRIKGKNFDICSEDAHNFTMPFHSNSYTFVPMGTISRDAEDSSLFWITLADGRQCPMTYHSKTNGILCVALTDGDMYLVKIEEGECVLDVMAGVYEKLQ